MMNVGRRRSNSGAYNPMADGAPVDTTGLELWNCVSQAGVQYYVGPEFAKPANGTRCAFRAAINAAKEGDWLKEKDTGLYLPFVDQDGARLFKNARLVLMEKATSGDYDGLSRHISRDSTRSNTSGGSGGSPGRRKSFRWVDDSGTSQRLAGDSEVLQDVSDRAEIWICVADNAVAYRSAKVIETVCGKECQPGAKVTAVPEDGWLRVIDVSATFSVMDAAEMIGRRSLKSASQVSIKDSGMFLPMTHEGQRLFKNEKVVLWEQSEGDAPIRRTTSSRSNGSNGSKGKGDSGCTVM